MALTGREKEIIKETWHKAKEAGGGLSEVGRAIFLRLFEISPETQDLFPFKDESKDELPTSKKLFRHGGNFARHIEKAVMGMDNVYGDVGPKFVALGARHYGYGAKEEHYPVVGEAMFDALQKLLGEDFTPEVHEAWSALYRIINDAMVEGGRDH